MKLSWLYSRHVCRTGGPSTVCRTGGPGTVCCTEVPVPSVAWAVPVPSIQAPSFILHQALMREEVSRNKSLVITLFTSPKISIAIVFAGHFLVFT